MSPLRDRTPIPVRCRASGTHPTDMLTSLNLLQSQSATIQNFVCQHLRLIFHYLIFTARKRCLRRLCFHRCFLSTGRGVPASGAGGMVVVADIPDRHPRWTDIPTGQASPQAHPPGRNPWADIPPGRRSTNGRYASH